jgi:hypothetical protein
MKKKNLIISLIIVTIGLIAGLAYYLNFSKPNCDEKEVILEGKLSIIQNKYPINVIETKEGTYWMYGAPKDFEENLDKRVRIEAILSPAYSQDIKCNICYRECPTCQCPMDEELLYDIKILEVLE